MPKQFEYYLVNTNSGTIDNSTLATIEDSLNHYGDQGWELCSIDYGALIFKREKNENNS